MGVPSFFRWLLEKYPRVIKYVKEEFIEYDDNGERILPDSSGKNPNGTEYDNLYLDMNGIIHPCCHPETGPQPSNEDEMISNVFKYIEHIFSMVRPRKLLYLAVDGVAPRAKMNQQRARRFRAAQEREELHDTRVKLESYYHNKGWDVPKAKAQSWDHNVITPGTPFMDKLAQALRYWVAYKLHNDSGWKGIKVILSDANIPGEGEHKIAQFIRRTRGLKGYDPNTRHVLYGLDADLFMLGLATHELYFTILREEVLFGKDRPCSNCGISGHWSDKCTNPPKTNMDKKAMKNSPFVFADLFILREYLEYELKIDDCEWWNLERVIDDFVFLCFFVGNDFLPHLPSLEIREGAIDNLLKYYKSFLPKFGGFLTQRSGQINLQRVQILLKQLGDIEDGVFKNRTQNDHWWKKREQNKKNLKRKQRIYAQKNKNKDKKDSENNNNNRGGIGSYHDKQSEINHIKLEECKLEDEYDENQMEFLEFFNEYDLEIDDHFMEKDFEHQLKAIHRASQNVSKCKKKSGDKAKNENENIVFGTQGFKQKYYFSKMKINYNENPPLLQQLIFEYIRGLCWVFNYYYKECVSWSWYYPFHYAPFASDLMNIETFASEFNFEQIKDKPFTPYGQLMGVLPASSGKIALPGSFSRLMCEANSPIIDFYPTDFKLDLNGKMYNWQAVILLPFVDAERLRKTIKPLEEELNDEQTRMNGIGQTLIFINKTHPLSRVINPLYNPYKQEEKEKKECEIDHQLSQGINGYISPNQNDSIGGILYGQALQAPSKVKVCVAMVESESGVDVMTCVYKLPADHEHKCKLLDGCSMPEPALDATDFEHMEKAPRFGKPKHFKRRDTHYNYNRGWDANIGYAGGKYKAKHNKNSQYELNYQPTRREYEASHTYNQTYNQTHNYQAHAAILNDFKPKAAQPQKQWTAKQRDNDNIHSKTSNGNGPYNNYNNNSRNYNSRRNNTNNYQSRQQQNQTYNQYYSQYNPNNTPTHQQWYPQQQAYPNYQTQYYNNNNNNNYYNQNPYQQHTYYQTQQNQNYSNQYPQTQNNNNNNYRPRYQPANQSQKPQQTNPTNQSSRKWG